MNKRLGGQEKRNFFNTLTKQAAPFKLNMGKSSPKKTMLGFLNRQKEMENKQQDVPVYKID